MLHVMAVLLAAGGAFFFLGLCLAMVYEAWALAEGEKPITDFVRGELHNRPHVALLVAVVGGLVLGHFLWH